MKSSPPSAGAASIISLAVVVVVILVPRSALAQREKVDFEKQILPILERSCVECHKAPFEEENGRIKKPKADLRLDGAWAIMKGGENGPAVIAGKADESELYLRTTLPADDDDVMPPEGKAEALTDADKELLKNWIDQGTQFGGWAGNLEGKPEGLTNTGEEIPVSEIQVVYEELGKDLPALKKADWKTVAEAGGRVQPLARETSLLSVDFKLAEEVVGDDKIKTIGAIEKNVAHLDLSKSAVTDAGLAVAAKLPRLVKLDLHGTQVSDAGLKHLKSLENLRYLNLYGTQVTDAGLKELAGLKNLENVYLWNSKVTAAGVKALEKQLPKAEVSWK